MRTKTTKIMMTIAIVGVQLVCHWSTMNTIRNIENFGNISLILLNVFTELRIRTSLVRLLFLLFLKISVLSCRKSIVQRHFQSQTIREKVTTRLSIENETQLSFSCRLTKLNPQSLFNKLESLVLDYVREIRKQVLERFHTCSKTSHDVQLFISFLLDEYQMFIQAANNVSSIVAYLVRSALEEKTHTSHLFSRKNTTWNPFI